MLCKFFIVVFFLFLPQQKWIKNRYLDFIVLFTNIFSNNWIVVYAKCLCTYEDLLSHYSIFNLPIYIIISGIFFETKLNRNVDMCKSAVFTFCYFFFSLSIRNYGYDESKNLLLNIAIWCSKAITKQWFSLSNYLYFQQLWFQFTDSIIYSTLALNVFVVQCVAISRNSKTNCCLSCCRPKCNLGRSVDSINTLFSARQQLF